MSDCNAKMHKIRFTLRAQPQSPLGTQPGPLTVFKRRTSKGEGGEKKGRSGKWDGAREVVPSTLTLIPERQSARMSKITNDGLSRSGTGCFIAVGLHIWQLWASKD